MDSTIKQLDLDLVLLAALEPTPLYGLEILKVVNTRTKGALEFKEGSLYPALHRLVKAGWVSTQWEPSDTGGAPRKYYKLTDSGANAYRQKKDDWAKARNAMDHLIGKLIFKALPSV